MARHRSPSPSRERSRPSRHAQRDRVRDRGSHSHSHAHSHSRRHSRSRSRSPSRSRERRRESESRDGGGGGGGGAKAEDKGGEISMSVEETNKLRAQLGLKPLSVGSKKVAEVNLQKTSAQVDAEREQRQIQQALAQSRKKRELSQKLAGESIGEQLRKEQAARDALSWVKRSRVSATASARKNETARSSKRKGDAIEAYDASALAGVTVGHAADAFEEGRDVVLTLKDASVLATDGKDVNDADDELVNVELSERDQRSERQARAERAVLPAYMGYDDDEFVLMGNPRAKKRTTNGRKLLAQYDEDADALAAEEARKFTLDASGTSAAAMDRGGREGDADGAEDDDVAVISLSMDRSKTAADYYTVEEMEAQFKKKGKKLRKKKKKARRREESEQDAGDTEGDAATLIAQLEAEARKSATQDRGSRKRRHAHDGDGDEDEDGGAVVAEDREGLKRFQHAREKASVTAAAALAASNLAVEGGNVVQTVSTTRKKRRATSRVDEDAAMVDEALDLELSASLDRARRLAQLQEARGEEQKSADDPMDASAMVVPAALLGPASEDKIALLVRTTVGVESQEATSDRDPQETAPAAPKPIGNVFGVAPGAADPSANAVVFNDATDFETRLRSAMEKRAAQFQAAATSGMALVGSNGSSASTSVASATASKASETAAANAADMDEEMKAEDEASAEGEEDDTGDVFGEEQPLVSSGLGATLALLKKTGDLREARVERQAGRANDMRDRNVDKELRIKDGVKLDYRDEFGRVLTKKEAFRMLSYKFHGHGPGKKKQDKRLRQLKQELEAQKLLSAEGSTKMMEVLEKKQKAGKQAHVVLSSGS